MMGHRSMKGCVVGLMVAIFSTVPAWADKETGKAVPTPAVGKTDSPSDGMKKEIGALQMQAMTVQILAMQYQKELNNLQHMQTTFCEANKLDVEKFRQGKYRYEEKEGKFVEREPAPAS